MEAAERDSVKLICEVSKPDADVSWFKGDEELPEGGRYEHIVDGKRRILLIRDLKMADAGEYNCRLSPAVKTSGNLKINGMEHRFIFFPTLLFLKIKPRRISFLMVLITFQNWLLSLSPSLGVKRWLRVRRQFSPAPFLRKPMR